MYIEKILNATSLSEMISEIEEFCKASYSFDDDEICLKLKNEVAEKDTDMHSLLSAYLCVCEDKDEVVEALYDFVSNCSGFEETADDDTAQVTKEEFEEVLNECEEKCMLKSCIEKEHTIITAEADMTNRYREFAMRIKNNYVCDILPKIDKTVELKKYIAEELGSILYDVLKDKFEKSYIRHEMERYIPAVRTDGSDTRTLFKKHFYDVVLYQERKPGIYTEIDDHIQRVFSVEYFKRMIKSYLKE